MKAVVALSLLLTAPTTHANEKLFQVPASYCPAAAAIAQGVNDCTDNDAFIQAGEACLEKLEAEVKRAAGTMRKNFAKGAVQAQNEKFSDSIHDYALGSEALAYLTSIAKMAIAEVSLYPEELAFPEDMDAPDITGKSPESYAMSTECYGDTKRSLDGLVQDFQHVLANLQKTKAATDERGETSLFRRVGLKNEAPAEGANPKLQQGKGQGSGKTKEYRDSGISGIEEDAAARKQKPK